MSNKEYLNKLMSELDELGVARSETTVSTIDNSYDNIDLIDDKEMRVIMDLEAVNGQVFSDEQKDILRHKGSAAILATAGAGKTQTSVNLIAKRIMTGEIDPARMVYTTYSKAGATEMKTRLEKLLEKLGIRKRVQVRTLHSFFLELLRTFGITNDIISEGKRLEFVREACKEAEFVIKDDDLMTINNLLSYQVNNLLSDNSTITSYVNTLEDLTVETYSKIRQGYAIRKTQAKLIDYDDMQTYLYIYLVKFKNSVNEQERKLSASVRDYCRSLYDHFFIDEAQDVSKLQFAIIKAMIVSDNDNKKIDKELVFIGDDDQCLVEGTKVYVQNTNDKKERLVNIEDVQKFDWVKSPYLNGSTSFARVDNVSKKRYTGKVVRITTSSGKVVTATPEHIGFVAVKDTKSNSTQYYQWTADDDIFADVNLVMLGNRYDENFRGDTTEHVVNIGIKTKEHFEGFKDLNETVDTRTYGVSGLLENGTYHNIYYMHDIDFANRYVDNIYFDDGRKIRVRKFAQFTIKNQLFELTKFEDIKVGDRVPVTYTARGCTTTISDTVESVEFIDYDGFVYDLSVPKTRCFIADDVCVHNCIYEWRGSDPSIILSIGPTFDIKTFILSTNYRCKSEIVDYASASVKCNSSRYNKSMQAFETGGNVKIAMCGKEDLCSLSTLAFNHIKYWISQGEKLSDIAVLCRNNFHLAILSSMLLKDGIYCYMSDEMKLTKSYLYKDIKALIDMCQESWKHELIRNVLWKLCKFMSANNARMIADFMNNSNLTIRTSIGFILQNMCGVDVNFHESINIPTQAFEKIKYYMRGLSHDTLEDLEYIYRALSLGVGNVRTGDNAKPEECLKMLLYKYLESTKYLYKTADKKRSAKGLVVYINALATKYGYEGLLEFLRITQQFENGGAGIIGERITLSTMHSAKGREWRNVIMFGCDNVSEPSLDGIAKMDEDGVAIKDIYENIEQERRLVYVGNTRAKENLLVVTGSMPSMFILESLGCVTQDHNDAIYKLAMNPDRAEIYKTFVEENIANPNSKYYYDINAYKT